MNTSKHSHINLLSLAPEFEDVGRTVDREVVLAVVASCSAFYVAERLRYGNLGGTCSS
jgi:hypothetical protein